MGKNPTWPVYIDDLIGGTYWMTDEQFGAYVRLLMAQWKDGDIDPTELENLIKSHERTWPAIGRKFKTDASGKLYNERGKEVRAERDAYSESRANNRRGKIKNTSLTYDNHMITYDNHMGDGDGDGDGINKKGVPPIQPPVPPHATITPTPISWPTDTLKARLRELWSEMGKPFTWLREDNRWRQLQPIITMIGEDEIIRAAEVYQRNRRECHPGATYVRTFAQWIIDDASAGSLADNITSWENEIRDKKKNEKGGNTMPNVWSENFYRNLKDKPGAAAIYLKHLRELPTPLYPVYSKLDGQARRHIIDCIAEIAGDLPEGLKMKNENPISYQYE